MKLTEELKKRIDDYFEKVTAEELYEVSSIKYGFTEDLSVDVEDKLFTRVEVDVYPQKFEYTSDPDSPFDPIPTAA